MRIDAVRDLGLRIRDQRLSLRMSQAELAAKVGASRSWVFQMERGNAGAEIGLVLKALHALGLEMDVRPATCPGTTPQGEDEPYVHDLAAILARARS